MSHSLHASFPTTRLRRNRSTPWIRNMLQEHRLDPSQLIHPLFITDGVNKKEPIASLPGIYRYSRDMLHQPIQEATALGIKIFALFPSIDSSLKDALGSEGYRPHNLVYCTVESLKSTFPDIGIITDVALDPYTTHGQDGVINNGVVDNDATVELLCKQAILQAQAGADIVAPSDMMDGRVGAIRAALDAEGLQHVLILSYAVKYASCFYNPFRDAVGSLQQVPVDKKDYQMNPANRQEAIREVALDITEGADMVMVKPALPYLDIIADIHRQYPQIPVLAYQVSGEYAMIKAAAKAGILEEEYALMETVLGMKRAGAQAIITYGACAIAKHC